MIKGMKILGRSRLSKILVAGSKIEYETKKMVSVALNWAFDMPRSSCKPTSFALPIFVLAMGQVSPGTERQFSYRSRNDTR